MGQQLNVHDYLGMAEILVGFAVLLVSLGRWGGKLETRRPPAVTPAHTLPEGSNGHASLGELERSLQALRDEFREDRREYLTRSEAAAKFDAVWGEIKNLRAMDSAAARRIDGLMGS